MASVNAGQALVQFAKRPESDREYAIKFFLHPETFYAEARLVAEFVPALRGCISQMPALQDPPETDASEMGDTSTRLFTRAAGADRAPALSLHAQGARTPCIPFRRAACKAPNAIAKLI